jgi:hypothetical protein
MAVPLRVVWMRRREGCPTGRPGPRGAYPNSTPMERPACSDVKPAAPVMPPLDGPLCRPGMGAPHLLPVGRAESAGCVIDNRVSARHRTDAGRRST